MVKTSTIIKHRYLMLFVLALASIVFTGCDKGSLGIKAGAIHGYILDNESNQPISEVLVRAVGDTDGGATENKTTYSDGDGSFTIGDVTKGKWTLSVEKFGYSLVENQEMSCKVSNGETIVMSPIKLNRTASGTKGILKGYPIDSITGRAITNFTVSQDTPYNERKSKTFDTASTFRDNGWTGLEGGAHNYTISAKNYTSFTTTKDYPNGVTIGKSAIDLGVIKMEPQTVDVSGTFRNLPGYVISKPDIVVWAESAGKVVASYTSLDAQSSKGTITYVLKGVPVTAGSVSIKCKVKGYDVITISSAVSIASANPGGVIAGIDIDFSNQEPIRSDLRVIVVGNKPDGDSPSTFPTNHIARIYVQAGGNDIVPYTDVTSNQYGGEATISGVITGYELVVFAVNQNKKYCFSDEKKITIPEGTEIFPVTIQLEEN